MDRSADRKTAKGSWIRPRVLVIAIVVVVLAVVAAVVIFGDQPMPVAEGRESDACTGRGPGALVGLDMRTGEVRWTNVVGRDLLSVEPHGAGKVLIRQEDRRRDRVVSMANGAVERCLPGGTEPDVEPAPEAIEVPPSITLPPDQHVLGAFANGIAVERDLNGPGVFIDELRVLDPKDGSMRWTKKLHLVANVVTADDVVILDPDGIPSFEGGDRPSRLFAYRLADGTVDWKQELPSTYRLFGSDRLVFAAQVSTQRLAALDAKTGHKRWDITLPNPGRGGKWTDGGDVRGVVVDGNTGIAVVAVVATEPYRD